MGKINKLPSYWLSDEGVTLIEYWCSQGYSKSDIAKKMRIGYELLNQLIEQEVRVRDAILKGSKFANFMVEKALYQSAIGGYAEDVTINYEGGTEVTRTVKKRSVAPNPTAAMMWLSNKDKENWKRNQPEELPQQREPVQIEIIPVEPKLIETVDIAEDNQEE